MRDVIASTTGTRFGFERNSLRFRFWMLELFLVLGQNWWQLSPTGPKAVRTLVLESIRDAPTRKQMLESVRGTSVTEDAIAIENSNRCAALLTRRSVHVCFALLNSIRSVLTDAQTCRQFRDNHALDTEHGIEFLQMVTTWAVPGDR